ncbi:thiamine pyrophosphate-dependent enzyme [Phycisphaera mikurensis]|uniref:Putative pyruvate dehydrogenase E1 component alpha subunit n=1 Tax=Phycisphaera mikurensis (strain NBRC 102666 / KCTC 22515 / FYK2301M01) TaxID=1142394 RepID=I0IAA0_PHYMF|nr:thiamine pyrophosphate-dependent enzyme [Phycisphaera mikurensis]MBB6441812.1 pyruvate dehydrogenase E1 component alpha subunit [Phycisphaera mikurensis]BAM02188.1 putative pyruvate dehydrogenase E1 component alpha subunit [Phycisphaera mikurensis NBRC 102666]
MTSATAEAPAAAAPSEGGSSDDAPGVARGADPDHGLSPERLSGLLYDMMLIRRFEERTMQAYQQAKIGGFCHIYIGQEATAVGAIAALKEGDPVVTAYRDHGHALAKGMHPDACMAEMFGKATGCAKGKGGSMHMFDKPNDMYGGHAIVGGQNPLGCGLGWGIQYTKKDHVALCFMGDGALNQGATHEAMNLASVYNLPLIFVLENNGYSMGTDIARGTAMAHDQRQRAEAYGMRYAECDGQDVLDTYVTFRDEVKRTRNARPINYNEKTGKRESIPTYDVGGRTPGPCFINVKTYRYQGHSMSDPQKYRSKDEVSGKQDVDCINRLVAHLIEHDLLDQESIDKLDAKAKDAAKQALAHAEAADPMPRSELFTDVYANPYGPYKQGEPNPAFAAPDAATEAREED